MRRAFFGLLVVGLLVAGCGATNHAQESAVATTVIATATATMAASPTPLATTPMDACSAATRSTGVVIGDLIVAVGPTNLNYPSVELPQNLPLAPYKLSDFEGSSLPRLPHINPTLTGPGGFQLAICNTSAARAHRIDSVDMRIDQFTPFSGTLNAWSFCSGSYSPQGAGAGGCGGGYETDANLSARFDPTASASAVALAVFTDVRTEYRAPGSPLALNLPPQKLAAMVTHLIAPTAPGYYRFSLSLNVDGASTPFVAEGETLLLDPQARNWDGTACQAPNMKAQIPTGASGYYICP